MGIRREFLVYTRVVLIGLMLAAFGSAASAQSFLGLRAPEVNVFAGYSLLRYDSVPLGFADRQNLSGANIEISLPDIYKNIGIVADGSAHYSSQMENFNLMFGPQYRYEVKGMWIFGHGLWGRTRTRLKELGASQLESSTLGYGVAFGGGLDIPLKDRFSIRPIQADYIIASQFGDRRKNMRYSAGIVIRFGKVHKAPSF